MCCSNIIQSMYLENGTLQLIFIKSSKKCTLGYGNYSQPGSSKIRFKSKYLNKPCSDLLILLIP